jgi:hypothetical protein
MEDQERQLFEKLENRDVIEVQFGGDQNGCSIRLKLDDGSDIWFITASAIIHVLFGKDDPGTIKAASSG